MHSPSYTRKQRSTGWLQADRLAAETWKSDDATQLTVDWSGQVSCGRAVWVVVLSCWYQQAVALAVSQMQELGRLLGQHLLDATIEAGDDPLQVVSPALPIRSSLPQILRNGTKRNAAS